MSGKVDTFSVITSESLSKNNYSMWKYHMTVFLKDQGLYGLVASTDVKPPGLDTDLDVLDWSKHAHQVRYLSLCVSLSMFGYIQSVDTPKEIWNALANVF